MRRARGKPNNKPAKRPRRPAKLTDVHVKAETPLVSSDVKRGNLTSDRIDPHEKVLAPSQIEILHQPRPLSGSIWGTFRSQELHNSRLEPRPSLARGSDAFNFGNLGSDDGNVRAENAGGSESEIIILQSRDPFTIDAHDTECDQRELRGPQATPFLTSVSADGIAENEPDATESYLGGSPPVCVFPLAELTNPTRADDDVDLPANDSPDRYGQKPQVIYRSSLAQIVTIVMGGLLIIAGVALVAVPIWYDAQLRSAAMTTFLEPATAMRLSRLAATASFQASWFGLALIVAGATLEVIGLRSRPMVIRA